MELRGAPVELLAIRALQGRRNGQFYTLGEEESRRTRYWLQSQMLDESDLLVDVHNPNLMESDLAEFYTDAATQVLETWLDDIGLQYVQLKKAPTGEIGGLRLVEYIEENPYIQMK